MVFIPTVSTPQAPSVQAMELAQRLQQTVAEYRQTHPTLTPEDIAQATRLAAGETEGASVTVKRGALAAVAAMVVALGSVVVFSSSGGGAGRHITVPAVAIGAAAIALVAAFVARRARER